MVMKTLFFGSGTLDMDKNNAFERALVRIGRMRLQAEYFPILPCDARSLIDAQPMGGDMAALGAENRAIESIERGLRGGTDVRYGLGVESFIEVRRGFAVDSTMVVLVRLDTDPQLTFERAYTTIALASSIGIPIPIEHVNEAMRSGLRTTTAGSCFARAIPAVSAKNWHATVTHGCFDRTKLVEDAIYAALCQVW